MTTDYSKEGRKVKAFRKKHQPILTLVFILLCAAVIVPFLMLVGVSLTFMYNMPFCFINEGLRIDYLFVIIGVVMSIYSGIQYFLVNKDFIFEEM